MTPRTHPEYVFSIDEKAICFDNDMAETSWEGVWEWPQLRPIVGNSLLCVHEQFSDTQAKMRHGTPPACWMMRK